MTTRSLFPICLCLLLSACAGIPAAAPSSAGQAATSAAPSTAPSSAAAKPAPSSAAASAAPASAQSAVATASASTQPAASANVSPSQSGLTNAEEQSIRAVQQVGPGVVKITHSLQGGQALGSGTIIDAKGYILTNAHVAEGATTYQVTLANNQTVQGKLLGLDPFDDLAVIQISQPDLPVVEMGDSSKLQVGQTVLAIGNPIGFTRTVTSGIVSALDRTIPEPPSQVTGQATTIPNMIQTSAPINPGNSGGALIDLGAKLVGVPTLAAADPELGGVAQGIAFAVPVNRAKVVIPQLISEGKIVHSGRAFLGVSSATVDARIARAYRLAVDHGAYLAQVIPNTPAAQAGLKQGDIIVKFDGNDVQSSADLSDAILNKKPGDQVQLAVYSGTNQKPVSVTLQEAPANQG
ncbi:MAG TPA: trypsin-like peptidase domain-containing protein [Chloroflexota bacterium]|nr:trypsin-like peptidase domain-containing protein [Chloroflexota bacterium]